jgi:hypothetical protein
MRGILRRPHWQSVSLLTAMIGFPCDAPTNHERTAVEAEIHWLQEHAVPLETADPDIPDQGLAVLRQTVGNARLVGLGEATHGTAEFWQIRQKISRYLVEEMGFQAILFEAPLPNGLHAWDVCSGTYTAFVEQEAAMPKDASSTRRFHQADLPLFYLDLDAIDYATPATAWLMGPL